MTFYVSSEHQEGYNGRLFYFRHPATKLQGGRPYPPHRLQHTYNHNNDYDDDYNDDVALCVAF